MTRKEFESAWNEVLNDPTSRSLCRAEYEQWLHDYHGFMCAAESDEELRAECTDDYWQNVIIGTKDAAAIRLINHHIRNL